MCPTSETPTASGPTTSDIGLFEKIISRAFPHSTKRSQLILASLVLGALALILGLAIAYRIVRFGDVGVNAVYAFLAVTGPMAVMAGASYWKKDNPPPLGIPAIPLPGGKP